MARKFSELRARMSPASRSRATAKAQTLLAEPPPTEAARPSKSRRRDCKIKLQNVS